MLDIRIVPGEIIEGSRPGRVPKKALDHFQHEAFPDIQEAAIIHHAVLAELRQRILQGTAVEKLQYFITGGEFRGLTGVNVKLVPGQPGNR
jgi:hypothetical protein